MTNKELIEKFERINEDPFNSTADGEKYGYQWNELYNVSASIAKYLKEGVALHKNEDRVIFKVYDDLVQLSYNVENGHLDEGRVYSRIDDLHKYAIEGIRKSSSNDSELYEVLPYSKNFLAIRERLRGQHYEQLFSRSDIYRYKKDIEKLNETLEVLKKESTKVASEQYAKVFHKEAVSNKEKSIWWLLAGIVVLGVFVYAFNWLNAILLPDPEALKALFDQFAITLENPSYLIGISVLSRALTITIGFFVLRFIARHYNVQRHLYTENKHRASALDAFKLFVNSVKDNDAPTHNALVLEVAKAISQPPQSGYLAGKPGDQTNVPYSDLVKLLGSNVPKS
ncbi:MAG: hypothetical protein WBB45_19690 [Cyclobacteriaceae bacterium]